MTDRDSPRDLSFFAAAPLNMEDLLEREVIEAGGFPTRIHRTGIYFSGPLECAYRLCLWSRIASRVLVERKRFVPIGSVYREVKSHPWEEEFEPSQTWQWRYPKERTASERPDSLP